MPKELNKVELDSDPNEGLDIIQNEDGSFMLEWDKKDPRWAMLNGLSQAQLEQIILKGLQEELGL